MATTAPHSQVPDIRTKVFSENRLNFLGIKHKSKLIFQYFPSSNSLIPVWLSTYFQLPVRDSCLRWILGEICLFLHKQHLSIFSLEALGHISRINRVWCHHGGQRTGNVCQCYWNYNHSRKKKRALTLIARLRWRSLKINKVTYKDTLKSLTGTHGYIIGCRSGSLYPDSQNGRVDFRSHNQ